MEHPHQYTLPGQPQGDGEHLHDGRGGDTMFQTSLSYQDKLAGRVLPISEIASMPADTARSTENLATLAPSGNFSHEVDHQAQLHHQPLAAAGGGRIRMPFPPVPKLDQLPGLPKVEASPVMPLPISSAAQLVYPPASGFGSITTNNPQASQAQHQVRCSWSLAS